MTIHAGGDSRSLRVTVDTTGLEQAMRKAPRAVYFSARDFLGAVFGKHRQQWLRNKGTKFGRGGAGGKAIKVFGVNEGPDTPADNHVVYHVRPKDQRMASERAAIDAMQQLRAEAFTGNQVLPVHEFGIDIRTSQWMAVPVRTRPGSPRAWRERYPNKTLVTRPGRAGSLLLFERTRKRGRGRPRKGAKAKQVESLRLRFVLTKHVAMQPTLHMYDTWDELATYRASAWKRAADRIERNLAQGVTD